MFLFTEIVSSPINTFLNCIPDDRPGSSVLFPLFDQEYNQTMDGNQKYKIASIMFLFTEIVSSPINTILNCIPDDRPGSSVLLPLFDQEYNQTLDGKLHVKNCFHYVLIYGNCLIPD